MGHMPCIIYQNRSKYYSLLPIHPYIVDGSEALINELTDEQLKEVLAVKKKYYDLSKEEFRLIR